MPGMAGRVRRASHQSGWRIGPGSGRHPVRGLQTVDRGGGHPPVGGQDSLRGSGRLLPPGGLQPLGRDVPPEEGERACAQPGRLLPTGERSPSLDCWRRRQNPGFGDQILPPRLPRALGL
eukprot:9610590-Alexandrium_andersonii.AAC.1